MNQSHDQKIFISVLFFLLFSLMQEHIKRSCEDRLDTLMDGELALDPKQLDIDGEPRASLERENHTNEMYKRQRNKRKVSHQQGCSSGQASEAEDRGFLPLIATKKADPFGYVDDCFIEA